MNTQSKSAQTSEQSNTQDKTELELQKMPLNAFETHLKHRVNACWDGQFLNQVDAINPSLERAAALADLIETACEVTDITSFEPDTLWRAAQAIRFEIKDAQALLKAYIDVERSQKDKNQA